MAWTTPRTWTDPEVVTAAMMNAHVRDNLNWVHGFHGCRLYKSADQTIASGNNDVLTWNSESFDTDALHSTSSNTSRIVIPSGLDGYWRVVCGVQSDADAANHNSLTLRLRKNAAGVSGGGTLLTAHTFTGHTNAHYSQTEITVALVATDHVECFFTATGEGMVANSGAEASFFSAQYKGA